MARPAQRLIAAIATALLLLALPSIASARVAYVVDYESHAVGVIDISANALAVPPIEAPGGTGPFSLAITPDGKTVWIVNYDSGSVTSLDTATNLFIGAPIPIAVHSFGFAITPDGSRAYVGNNDDDTVEVLDLQTRVRIGSPIPVGNGPGAVAITPDGSRAYVANAAENAGEEGTVSVIDTATNQVVGPQIPVGEFPFTSSFNPDGRFLFVPVRGGITVIDTATNQVAGPQIPLGEAIGAGVVISPDGRFAYAATRKPGTLSTIDVASRKVIAGPVPTPGQIEFLALTPDGKRLLVEQFEPSVDSIVDTANMQAVGPPIAFGEEDGQIAVVPDQSPTAAFATKGRARPGVPYALDGSSSTDPDGTVASWGWGFGDPQSATTTAPAVEHTFRKPGKFGVTLTVSDNEGCSVPLIFPGQTASCHGNPGAAVTKTIRVAYPGVRVRCPKSAGGPCRFELSIVARRGGKLKPQSSLARAKAKPGRKATISLRPKKGIAKRAARAKKLLIRQVVTIDGERTTRVSKLKVVQ